MMDQKARSSLEAADVLVDAGLFDSAASRAYYAAYLSGWSWLSANHEEPPTDKGGRRFWPHASFAERLFPGGALEQADRRDDFEVLLGRRIKADYFVDPIGRDEAHEAVTLATALVRKLLGDAHHG